MANDQSAERGTAADAAADLNTRYEIWWAGLDQAARQNAQRFFGFGIPDDIAADMTAAGFPPTRGVLASSRGISSVWLPRSSLTAFIAAQRDVSSDVR